VENYGLCGKCIPDSPAHFRHIRAQLQEWQDREPPVWLGIMLGTNDLLQGRAATAQEAAQRMKRFLEVLADTKIDLLLIAPPYMRPGAWVNEARLLEESHKLGPEYRKVAESFGIGFADAGQWEIALTFDGVHFSEEGHRKFAREMARVMRTI
jgi:lysophospholipase L1-like esterase